MQIKSKLKNSKLTICDFYNPETHTEISIKRARKKYPNLNETINIKSTAFPFSSKSFDQCVIFFSAHEIRNETERIAFFSEVKRILKSNGTIWVTEHLRDWKNFFVYNIGFLHFYSKTTWKKTFESAGLKIQKEISHTPFIKTFKITANGNSF